MTDDVVPPFSSRTKGAHAHIDCDFPQTARIGLLHILHDAMRRRCLNTWQDVAVELQRIARIVPVTYDESTPGSQSAQSAAQEILTKLPWDKVYDFCERLYGHLAREVVSWVEVDNQQVTMTRRDVQQHLGGEIRRLFIEEGLAFEFADGLVRRRGRRHTVDRISKAEVVLGDLRLDKARKHYEKALRYFRDKAKPDPENAIKEAVCAVEAAAKALFPEITGTTLGEVTKGLTGNKAGELPKAIAQIFVGLYAFRCGGNGVGHGGASGGTATVEIAEFSLAVAASQIILLVDLSNARERDIPF